MITMLSYVLFSYSAFDFPIHTLRLLHSLALASQLTLHAFCIRSLRLLNQHCLCLFPSYRTCVPKRPWPGSRTFPRNYPLERTDDTLMYPTMPRLSRLCLRFGRYLRPFVHDTTYMMLFCDKY